MLNHLKDFISSCLYKTYYHFKHRWQPISLGCRALLVQEAATEGQAPQILLVRHSYIKGWYLPGGGVQRREALSAAIVREVSEECQLQIVAPVLLGMYFSLHAGRSDHIALYLIRQFSPIAKAPQDPEIAECRFFALDALPTDTSAATMRRIAEYFKQQPQTEQW